MKKSLLVLLSIFFTLSFVSCNNDDDDDDSEVKERGENEDELNTITSFMKSYTYNAEDFTEGSVMTDQDIVFRKLEAGTTEESLFDLAEAIPFTYEEVIDDEDDDIYTEEFYLIKIREGAGKQIYFGDDVNITFQEKLIVSETEYDNTDLVGEELEMAELNEVFLVEQNRDSINDRTWVNSLNFRIGMQEALTKFKTASTQNMNTDDCDIFSVDENDGSLSNNNDFGIGIIIVPSGLAYFDEEQFYNNERDDDGDGEEEEENENKTNPEDFLFEIEDDDIYAFRNYVYTFSTYNSTDANIDGDLIDSKYETEEGTHVNFYDTDDDGIPNYLDPDDDGDELLTLLEIDISDTDSDVDSDCDGILTNDNNVRFIFTDTTAVNNKVRFSVPVVMPESTDDTEVTDDAELPFHLDASKEYDEDDYETE